MATKTKSRKAQPVEETEDDDVELEDLDEEVSEDEAATGKGNGQEVTFGVSDLVSYLKSKHGVETTPRELRALIRKMAREDNPRVDRDIVPGNRSRYDWPDGPKDPEVKAIIKAVVGGEMEADKKAKLAQLKEDKAKKTAAKAKAKAKAEKAAGTKKGRKARQPEPEELEDDDVEEVNFDEDED